MQPDEHAACIGHVVGHLRRRQIEVAHALVESGHVACEVMVLSFDNGGRGRATRGGDHRVAPVQAVALAKAALQLHAHAQHVGQKQRARVNQHTLAFRVRQARHWRAAQQTGGKSRGHSARFRRARFGKHLGVAGLQPHVVEDANKFNHLRTASAAHWVGHQSTQDLAFANAGLDLGRHQIGLVELIGHELNPQAFVLLPHHQGAGDALGVTNDQGKWRLRPHGCDRRRGQRRCRRGPRCRARGSTRRP